MAGPTLETIVDLCKRRGIVFQSAEIYGGMRSGWDYGPLGVELKENIKQAWWRSMVQLRDDIVGLDSSVILHPTTWEASGHVEVFTDPLVECLDCNTRHRADQIGDRCPNCGGSKFTDPRNFNLMFKTHIGPVEDTSSVVWLRPETAQGIFVDFNQVLMSSRKKLPFGIAQMGKSFRNEITPGNFIFRTREFEQMEMEYFVKPGTDEEHHQYWIDERYRWYLDLGMRKENIQLREHDREELSHYSKRTVDIEYRYPWGWGELEGIANRGDFDLTQHSKFSGEDLSYYDADTGERYIPYVIEPAAGATRALLAFIVDAYSTEEAPTASGKTEARTVLRLHPKLAPLKVAVLPLSRHDRLVPVAKDLAARLRQLWRIDYDDAGSIGKRYRRQDEVGTPYAVTVDFDSLEDNAVTVRDRDSMKQERVGMDRLTDYLTPRLSW
ncbi:MAG TPA: glycine--tRNA ligase [Actinomycetota bacterium]|jgi:glycyl-tRNA synthetase|nr:glycine--tRNA ligase [Actinomycetota bacterium]